MRDLGFEPDARFIPGGLDEEDGEAAAGQILADGAATAVTAFNDHCAAGLIAAVRARGVNVPDQLSVVGYDDSRIASLSSVALTTVAQDAAELASSACRLALSRIEDRTQPSTEVVVPPRLVVRRTSAEPA